MVKMNLAEAKARVQRRIEKLEHELKVLRKTLRWLDQLEAQKVMKR